MVGTGLVVGRGFGGNGRMVTDVVERGRVGIARRAPAGRRGTEPGGSVKPVVLEGGREYVGKDGNSEAGGRCRWPQGGERTRRIFGVNRFGNQCLRI